MPPNYSEPVSPPSPHLALLKRTNRDREIDALSRHCIGSVSRRASQRPIPGTVYTAGWRMPARLTMVRIPSNTLPMAKLGQEIWAV